MLSDIRLATRGLLRTPGLTIAVVLTLGAGIGLVTGMFAMLNGWAWADLPYDDADRIVAVGVAEPRYGNSLSDVSADLFAAIERTPEAFSEVAAYEERDRAFRTASGAITATIARAQPELFSLLRIQADRGRLFAASDPDQVAVITYPFWKSHFGERADIVGQPVYIDGVGHTIIGVLPAMFALDRGEVFIPLRVRPGDYVKVLARLRDGMSAEAAAQRLAGFAVSADDYEAGATVGLDEDMLQRVSPLRAGFTLMLFVAGTAFVLLIACSNVLMLLLARGIARRPSYAIRSALGASGRRLAGENLIESALIALLATALGVLLARWGLQLFVALVPANFPPWLHFTIDENVALFAGCVALFVVAAIGWTPARNAAATGGMSLMSSATVTSSVADARFGRRLVIAEVALSVSLFIGAVLLFRSHGNAKSFDVGYDDSNIAAAPVRLDTARFAGVQSIDDYLGRVEDGLALVPGGNGAYFAEFNGVRTHASDTVPARQLIPDLESGSTKVRPYQYVVVDDDYFSVIGVSAERGRTFNSTDAAGAPLAAVVTASLARKVWNRTAAVGETFRIDVGVPVIAVVIGVVPDQYSMRSNSRGAYTYAPQLVFFSSRQTLTRAPTFLLRSNAVGADVPALVEALRRADPDVAVWGKAEPLSEMNRFLAFGTSIFAQLLGILAALAFTLAMIGLFGVIAYNTRLRTREIGIRLALGATSAQVAREVLGAAFRLVGIGLGAGLLMAALIGKLLASMLLDVSAIDPVSYAVVAAVFIIVALSAAWIPSRRAMSVDPTSSLRS